MRVVVVSFIFLALIFVSSQKPFVFKDSDVICSYYFEETHEKIKITSNTWTAKFDQTEINYKLCGRFTNKNLCPVGTSACLKNHKTGRKLKLGSEFALDENSSLKSINGEACTASKNYSVVVNFHCSEAITADAYLIYIEDSCTYHIGMRDPKCPSKCATYIDGRFIDLRDLGKRSFSIITAERNFSITLCNKDPVCNDDVNACEIIGNKKTPISLASSISVSYIGEKNQLSFHGVTHVGDRGKIDKKIEIILVCDWDKTDIKNEDLQYVKKQTQGRKYTFQLRTSFGCIKKPISCVVNDQFLVYNLSGLHDAHPDMWSTRGGNQNSDSIYFLQVCGHVELEGKNTSCKSTYAQVCENIKGIDINRGSVLRHLDVQNDILVATIESGMQCKENPDRQYTTFIKYYCEKQEQGPMFLEQKSCDTYFTWKTPHACPYYNASSCGHLHEYHSSCIFEKNNNVYDLSPLAKVTKSIPNGNKEFLFSICGPVNHPDAPCMKDVSVAFRNLTEFNLKHKIISLGKFFGSNMENDNLVLEYATGSYCDGTDYTSKIRFECSVSQEEPIILKQEKCFYEFLWRTNYACPRKEENASVNNCSYIDNYSKKVIDFGSIDRTSIHLVDNNKYKYHFDICQRNYTNCTYNDDCQFLPIENTMVHSLPDLVNLEFKLPMGCYTKNDFNKVTFKFICDKIKNNEHIAIKEIVNCSVMINCFTNTVCSSKDDLVYIEQIQEPDQPLPLIPVKLSQPAPVRTTTECSNKSPFTKIELNVTNLPLKDDIFKKRCPTMVTFNDTYRFVKLLYVTTDICHPSPTKNLSYEVYLKCTHDKLFPAVNDECLEHYNDENLEYCNFFKPASRSNALSQGSMIGIVIGTFLSLAGLSSVIFIVLKRRYCTSYNGFTSIYHKEGDL